MKSVSVIIPCRDVGTYLSQAVRSALDQERAGSGLEVEVLVVDDGSTEAETLDVLKDLSQQGRVRVLENAGQPGVSDTRNTGFAASEGTWVVYLDGDDILLPGALRARLHVLEVFPQARWIGTDHQILRAEGQVEAEGFFASRPLYANLLAELGVREQTHRIQAPLTHFLRHSLLCWTGAVMLHRDLQLKVGGFDPTFTVSEDVHLWLRLAAVSDFYYLPRSTALYRQRPGSITNAGRPPSDGTLAVYRDLMEKGIISARSPDVRRLLHRFHLRNARYFREQRQFSKAFRHSASAIGMQPRSLVAWRQAAASLIRRP